MDFQTAVACGVLFLYGKGNLEEKAAMFGVRYSTFHRMAHMVIDELISRSSEVIYIPRLEDQVFLKCARTKLPFTGALFAIDGTLCKCAVKGKSNECYTRKGQAQLNVQVMCNWNLDLVYVDSNYSGKTHDNDMLLNSPLYRALQNDLVLLPGGFIVGDEGYACDGHVMRPYGRRTQVPERQLFNVFYRSTRRIIENAIGAWKKKVPLLNIGLHETNLERLAEAIHASAVLYQFCKRTEEALLKNRLNEPPPSYLDQEFVIPASYHGKGMRELRDHIAASLAQDFPDCLAVIRSGILPSNA